MIWTCLYNEQTNDKANSKPLFTMDGAVRTDNTDGTYSLRKTGTGTVVSEAELMQRSLRRARERAEGTGPEAERARAHLDALSKGTLEVRDMSDMGVTSTVTETVEYGATGRATGQRGSWNTGGMDKFLEQYVVIKDGQMFDKATGKHAGIGQNGTSFTYAIW